MAETTSALQFMADLARAHKRALNAKEEDEDRNQFMQRLWSRLRDERQSPVELDTRTKDDVTFKAQLAAEEALVAKLRKVAVEERKPKSQAQAASTRCRNQKRVDAMRRAVRDVDLETARHAKQRKKLANRKANERKHAANQLKRAAKRAAKPKRNPQP